MAVAKRIGLAVAALVLAGCGDAPVDPVRSTYPDASVGGYDPSGLEAPVGPGATSGGPATAMADASTGEEARDGGDDGASVDAGPATLQSLAISPLTLTPAFSPDIHDYSLRCASGTQAVAVTMSAASGGTVALLAPTTSSPAASATARVEVADGQAIVVRATLGATSADYWVRCLPPTFPQLSTTLYPDAGAVPPGYYLISDSTVAVGEVGYAMALDPNGTPVWYAPTTTGAGAANVQMLEPGTISFTTIAESSAACCGGEYEIEALDPFGLTFVKSVGVPLDPHELRILPNGDYLVFATPVLTGVDLTGLSGYGQNEDMLGCVIQDLSPSGQLVWEWDATDHLDPVEDCTWPTITQALGVSGETLQVVDPFHCNSIDVDEDGDLLVSARATDSIFLISAKTGDILWKVGGSPYTKDGATFIPVVGDADDGFHRQHDARFLPDGDISLFDDETDLPGPARGLVLSVDVAARQATVKWQVAGAGSVIGMGSVTLLPDGSRVIGWGQGAAPAFSEVTEAGAHLLDFSFADGDSTYRAVKIPASAVDLGALRAAVGMH